MRYRKSLFTRRPIMIKAPPTVTPHEAYPSFALPTGLLPHPPQITNTHRGGPLNLTLFAKSVMTRVMPDGSLDTVRLESVHQGGLMIPTEF